MARTRMALWCGLVAYSAVMLALTMFKAFYRIGYLWDPARQRRSGVSWVLFDDLRNLGPDTNWFIPVFGYGGNVAFFIPLRMLIYALLYGRVRSAVALSVLLGAVISVLIELSQYAFSLGFSDIDDVITNALGALIGAVIAKICGPKMFPVWAGCAILLGVVFAVLVGLGERLGDPSRIAPS